jgi:hypothetical protein
MRFKILVFVLTLGFVAGTFLAAYWFYDNVEQPERDAQAALERRVREAALQPAPDPAAASYQKAMEALEAGEIESAHEQLSRLLKVYPSSPRVVEARRILGEINLDRLFSRAPMPGKRDYIVKPGDSLARIEKGSLTTIPFLKQINNLTGLNLQPGDRLVYQPLEFELEIDLSESRLTVWRQTAAGLEPAFFKDYPLTSILLPTPLSKPLKTQIQEKIAWLDGRKLLVSDPRYSFARKRLMTTSRPGRLGLLLRPDSDRHDAGGDGPEAASGADGANAANAAKKPHGTDGGAGAGVAEAPAKPATLHGIFLADSDLEELSTILRTGTPVMVRP